MKSCLKVFKIAAALALSLPLAAAEPGYEAVPNWPASGRHSFGICAGIGVDASNRVFVFQRGTRQWQTPFPAEAIDTATVVVLDGKSGDLLDQWGENCFIMPHGLSLDNEGNVWLTDVGLHQIYKYTPDGKLLMTLGERGVPGSDAGHFDRPTDVAVLPDGSFYVSDGYRNTRVAKFSADGRYLFEWGGKGTAAGSFNLPHGVAADAGGNVYVCDRENLRLQVFAPDGAFRAQWQGQQIGKPYGVSIGPNGNIFIIDGGLPKLKPEDRGKVVELDPSGKVIHAFGSGGSEAGQFQLGHDIATGPDGAVYVAEATGRRVQKFVKRPPPHPPMTR